MKKTKSILLSAAVSGLLFGTAAASLTSCASTGDQPAMEKHSCKGMNACKGQGWVTKASEKECKAAGGTVAK